MELALHLIPSSVFISYVLGALVPRWRHSLVKTQLKLNEKKKRTKQKRCREMKENS